MQKSKTWEEIIKTMTTEQITSIVNAHEALIAVVTEVMDHLYTRQDIDRCKSMAKAALAEGKP